MQCLGGEQQPFAAQLLLVGAEQAFGRFVQRLPVAMAAMESRHLEPDPVRRQGRAVGGAQVLGHLGQERRGLAHPALLLEQLRELGGHLYPQLLRRHLVQLAQGRDRLVALRLLGEDQRSQVLRAQMGRLRPQDGVDQRAGLVRSSSSADRVSRPPAARR